jgi:hypothetical protein
MIPIILMNITKKMNNSTDLEKKEASFKFQNKNNNVSYLHTFSSSLIFNE